MLKTISILSICFLGLILIFSGCNSPEKVDDWQVLEKDADALVKAKDLENGLIKMKRVLHLAPKEERNRIYLKVHELEFQYKIQVAEDYIIKEKYTEAFLFARDYLTTGEFKKAIAFFDLIKQNRPEYDNGIVYFSLVKAYQNLGDLDTAFEIWEEGRKKGWGFFTNMKKSRFLQLKAKLYIQKEEYQFVKAIIDETDQYHKLAENYYLVGFSESKLGNTETAKKYLLKSLTIKPGYKDSQNLLFKIIPFSKFDKKLLIICGITWDVEQNLNGGIKKFKAGKFELSHQDFEIMLNKNPQSEHLFFNWANELKENLENELKNANLKKSIKNKNLLMIANILHYIIGDGVNAKINYLSVLKSDNKNFNAYLNYGIILQKENKIETAFENLKKAVQLNPKSGRANFFLGINYLRIGNLESAFPYLSTALKLSPDFSNKYFTKLIFNELPSFVPYDKKDIEVLKKYELFFKNDKIYSEDFKQLVKKLDRFK
ncbi:hypothetical protein KAU33_01285 [Candidatus Dependentiae bacterium]|nr:hypothetical protein [Candidatus Dependentiae bacterium]